MSKIFFACLAAVLIIFYTALAPAQNRVPLTPEILQIMHSEPLAAATVIFESAATSYNQRIDQVYADQPKEQRPYVTTMHIATIVDNLIKEYYRGDKDGAILFTSTLGIEVPIEEKVALIEKITRAYLQSEPQTP